MALCLSQSEFCQKGAQVGYSATYSPVVGQTKLTTLATVDSQFITQTVRLSSLQHVAREAARRVGLSTPLHLLSIYNHHQSTD